MNKSPSGIPRVRVTDEATRNRLVRLSEAAVQLGLTEKTVRRWIACGYLPAIRLPSGQLRIYQSEVNLLLRPVRPAEEK